MNTFALLQFSDHVAAKSAEMAIKDPNGIIMTLVSISMVFCALIILYLSYSCIGVIFSRYTIFPKRQKKTSTDVSDEVAVAIAHAIHLYFNADIHDKESYKITIKRK